MMQRRPLLAAFFLPVLIMMIIVIAKGIYPFGDRSFLRIDLYNQYYPFFTEYWRKLHTGGNLSYSWYLGLGGSFAGLYAYYLASPLHLLLLLCPEAHILECMGILILLKIGLCGLCFAWFLKEHAGTDSYLISLFGLLYALSGFMAAYNWNIMWLDVVYLAPVATAGLERLVDIAAGRKAMTVRDICLYPVALGVAILCNYYLCIMLCIFLVLYFLVLIVDLTRKQAAVAFLRFTLGSLLGGAISAIVSLPGVLALRVTKFDDPSFGFSIKVYFQIQQAMMRHFVSTVSELRTDHWPNVYCGVIVLLLVPLWFLYSDRSRKCKIAIFALLAFFWASFSLNILTFFWHGLNFPDSLPARQSYLYILLVLTISFEALQAFLKTIPADPEEEPELYAAQKKQRTIMLLVATAIGGVFIGLCCLFGRTEAITFVSMGMTALYFVVYVIEIGSFHLGGYSRRFLLTLMLVAVFSETCMNTYRVSVATTAREAYMNSYETNRMIMDVLKRDTPEPFFRVDEWDRFTKNDGLLVPYPSATYFSSTASGGVENLYRKLGMSSSKVFYHMDGAVPLTSAMLGLRYMIAEDNLEEEDHYTPVLYTKDYGDSYMEKTVMKANACLPIGYMLPSGFSERWAEEIEINRQNGSVTPVANLNAFVRALGFDRKLFRIRQDKEGGNLFAYVISSPKKSVKLITKHDEYAYEKINYRRILELGSFRDGSEATIEPIGAEWNKASKLDYHIYVYDDQLSDEVIEKLGKQPFLVTEMGEDSIRGTVDCTEAGDLVLSIPAEEGWQIMVDGQETEMQTFEDAFIRIPLTEGTHEVNMTFRTPGRAAGVFVSLCGALCLCLWAILEKRSAKRRESLLQ